MGRERFESLMNIKAEDPYNTAEKKLEGVLSQWGLNDKLVSIYVVSGDTKLESRIKFLHLIQCLAAVESKDKEWFFDDSKALSKKLKKLREVLDVESSAVVMWSKPFMLQSEVYGKVAVFLMLTNTEYIHESASSFCSVFEFTSLISACSILFLEPDSGLNFLEKEPSYIGWASDDDLPVLFQSLIIARRNWEDEKYSLGFRGGSEHLNKISAGGSCVSSNISMFFADVTCTLLPPGNITRKMRKEEATFLSEFRNFYNHLFKNNVSVKKLRGRPCIGYDILKAIAGFSKRKSALLVSNPTDVRYICDYAEPVTGTYECVSEVSSLVGCDAARLAVGGCVVDIPANALDEEVRITLTSYYGKLEETREITPLLKCEPHGLRFKKPITISLGTCFVTDGKGPVDVVIETSRDGIRWKKEKNEEMRGKAFVLEVDHFSFARVVLDHVWSWLGLLKRKAVTFRRRTVNIWNCTLLDYIDATRPSSDLHALHGDSLILTYSHAELSVKIQSESVVFHPGNRTISDAFRRPRASVDFLVEQLMIDPESRILGEVRTNEIHFTILHDDNYLLDNCFWVDFADLDKYYDASKLIGNCDWLEFARTILRIDDLDIDHATRNHPNDMKEQRIEMLGLWKNNQIADESTPAFLKRLVDQFMEDKFGTDQPSTVSADVSEAGNPTSTYVINNLAARLDAIGVGHE